MIGLLQYLAASPLILGSMLMASIPTAEAASLSHPARSHHNHNHLARRLQKTGLQNRSDSEVRAVKADAKRRVKKRAPGSGGKTCRIRQQGGGVSSLASASASATSVTEVASASATASVTDAATAAASTPVQETAAVTTDAWTSAAAESTQAQETWASSTWVEPTAASSSVWVQPSATAAAPTTGAAGSGGWLNAGSKVGLCWPNGDWSEPGAVDYVGNFIGSTVSFMYDWHYQGCKKASDLGIEYVPMMWGAKDAVPAFYEAQANWPETTKHVLFFNEPNDPGQSNISPEGAVQFWKQYMSPLKAQGYLIGMAATTSAPSGLEWVLKFKEVCPECWAETDFVPLHYYDVSTDHFKQYVTNYHDAVQKPIWITEYACQNFNGGAQCTWDETMNFHYEMASWFNEQSWVERYSPFGAMKNMQGVQEANRLMDAGGAITPLGAWYAHSA